MNTEWPDEAIKDENRRMRLLRVSTDLVVQVLMSGQAGLDESLDLIEAARKLALELFPGKDDVFDLIYLPRFRRALYETGLLREHGLGIVERAPWATRDPRAGQSTCGGDPAIP